MSNSIPDGWNKITIGEFTDRVIDNRGKTPPLSDSGYELIEIGALSASDRFPRYSKVRKYVDAATHGSWFRAGHLQKGDILIPTVGTIGICCILNQSRGSIAQNLIGLRIKNDNDPVYTYYIISSYWTVKQIEMIVMNAVQPSLKVPQFLGIEVLQPPLPEQQKIAAILSTVDDVIEKTRAQIDKLKDLKTGMMQELLSKGIGHTEFKDSPVGRIPVGWDVMSIGELLEFKNGLNKEKEYFGRGNPIVNFTDVFHGQGLRLKDLTGKVELTRSEQERFKVRRGDVFFTRTSEVPNEIGMSAVFLDQAECVSFSGFTLRGRPTTEKLEVEFCKYCFSSDYVRGQIISSCSYTTRALTNGPLLSQCLVAVPPKQEQLKIARSLDSLCDLIKCKENMLSISINAKKALMQDLLTGKVRVKIDDKESAVA